MDLQGDIEKVFLNGVNELRRICIQLDTNDRLHAANNLQQLIHDLNVYSSCGQKSLYNQMITYPFRSNGIQTQDVGMSSKRLEVHLRAAQRKDMTVSALKEELAKLIEEKQVIDVKILELEKRISQQESDDPHTIVKEILKDILLRIVPNTLGKRKRGRPKGTGNKRSTRFISSEKVLQQTDLVEDQPLVKKGRGRPKKQPTKQSENIIVVQSQNENSKESIKHASEVVDTSKLNELSKKIVNKENSDTSTSINLRSRRTFNVDSSAIYDSDDDFIPLEGEDTRVRNYKRRANKAVGTRPAIGVVPRPRGRPRKKPFRDPDTIKRHEKVVRHICKLCNSQFIHGRPFNRHLSSKHESGGVCCVRCKKEFENHAHFLHHKCEATRRLETRRCKRCNINFKSFKKLQEHAQFVHGLKHVDPIHFCKFCHKGFIRRPSLIAHMRTHANGLIVCEKCGVFCESEEELKIHMEIHKTSASESLLCKRCGTVFFRKQQFEQHMAAHDKYDCSICNEAFSRKKSLIKHVRDVHNIRLPAEEKKHVCLECKRRFHRPGQLEIHMRVHTGERPIECETCKMFFKSNKALWKHKQTHTHLLRQGQIPQERNHLCSVCGKSYFRKQALQRHMRYHDDNKPFKCPHCAYQCRDNNNLKRHIQLHFSDRQFVCETCGASFHAKKTLETHHLYKHSSERTHQCNVCPMTFKTQNSLRRHLVIHATVRPYKCPSCNVGFNRLYNLRRHMKGVHGTDASLPPVNRVKLLDVSDPEDQPSNRDTSPNQGNTVPERRKPESKCAHSVQKCVYEVIDFASGSTHDGGSTLSVPSGLTQTVQQGPIGMPHETFLPSTYINQPESEFQHIPTSSNPSQGLYRPVSSSTANEQPLEEQKLTARSVTRVVSQDGSEFLEDYDRPLTVDFYGLQN